MDVHPDEIDTVSVRLEDESIVYAVAACNLLFGKLFNAFGAVFSCRKR